MNLYLCMTGVEKQHNEQAIVKWIRKSFGIAPKHAEEGEEEKKKN